VKKPLARYRAKRDFAKTPEPVAESSQIAEPAEKKKGLFCVQKHDATRLHYDVRLEIGGVLMCFAVPKGPSYDPKVKRLAIETEDHPLKYLDFEARIPEGQYGAGDMLLWDVGSYETVPPGQEAAMRAKGHLHVCFFGDKLRGGWHFVKTKGDWAAASKAPQWLMFKADDETADPARDIVVERPESIKSGKSATRGPRRVTASPSGQTAKSLLDAAGDLVRPTLLRDVDDVKSYLYEIKYDGYRLRAVKAGQEVELVTRGGHDWTERFVPVAAAVRRLPAREAVLDGEVCVVNDSGRPSFQALQEWLAGERPSSEGAAALAYVVFDITWLDGRDLRDAKLEERRELLEALLQGSGAPLSFSRASSAATREELTEIVGAIRAAGLEGLVAKRRGSKYLPGQSGVWRKLKFSQRQDCVIVGWVPMTGAPKVLGAVVVAVMEGGKLRYAGRVGTGLEDKMRGELLAQLGPLVVDTPPVEAPRTPGARWVTPALVCEVEYAEWSRDGSLRTPIWIGLREDKRPEECTVDDDGPTATSNATTTTTPNMTPNTTPTANPNTTPTSIKLPPLSNPQKILFPRDGITKQDILAYYLAIAPVLLPHLAARPVTLQRWPDGIDDEAWYQHNAPYPMPPFVQYLAVEKKRRVIVDNVETLAWLVNLAALTLHVWSCRVSNLDQPDYTILDLDPGDGTWKDVVDVARAIRTILDSLSLDSAVKTSGKRGLHIVVPLAPGPTHEEATAFAERVAEAVAKVMPDVATTERTIGKRKGRLYIDFSINGRGKALVSPYSIRAIDGAPVSTPVAWSEVTIDLDPRAFTVRTMPARVARHGDLFALARTGRGRI
jgi:bifunctional non-homologous end joining protein LigD